MMGSLYNFLEIMEGQFSNTDKLLICVIILILITIIWTILIGLMYKSNFRKVYYKNRVITVDEDNEEDSDYEEIDNNYNKKNNSYVKVVNNHEEDKNDYIEVENNNIDKEIVVDDDNEIEESIATDDHSNEIIEDDELEEIDDREVDDEEHTSNLETYVKIRFYKSDRKVIYIAPEDMVLKSGDKIKVKVDDDTIRNAIVVKGNYIRKKYRNDNFKVLNIV